MNALSIKDKLDKLPENSVQEINEFLDYLLFKYSHKKTGSDKLSFDWEGGLEKLKGEYNSVELQHKASEWR